MNILCNVYLHVMQCLSLNVNLKWKIKRILFKKISTFGLRTKNPRTLALLFYFLLCRPGDNKSRVCNPYLDINFEGCWHREVTSNSFSTRDILYCSILTSASLNGYFGTISPGREAFKCQFISFYLSILRVQQHENPWNAITNIYCSESREFSMIG